MLMDVDVMAPSDPEQVDGLYTQAHTSLMMLWKASGSDWGSPNHNSMELTCRYNVKKKLWVHYGITEDNVISDSQQTQPDN